MKILLALLDFIEFYIIQLGAILLGIIGGFALIALLDYYERNRG